MSNIEVELYLSQVIKFFDSNPNDLIKLIGTLDKDKFYIKIREKAEANYSENGDAVLSKQQMIDIVVVLHNEEKKTTTTTNNLEKIFEDSKYGKICLN